MRRQLLMSIILWSLAAIPVLAEKTTSSEVGTAQGSERMARLASKLNLTPEQTAKLSPIIEKEREELRAVRKAHASDAQRMLDEIKAINAKYEGQIAAVLTSEQMGEWKKISDRRVQGAERLAQLQSRLKLTPEQADALHPILQQEMDELRAVREKHASDTSRRGKRNMLREMKTVQQKYEGQIGSLLTSEQKSEWKKIKEERRKQLKERYGK